jgi:hypothetical protein
VTDALLARVLTDKIRCHTIPLSMVDTPHVRSYTATDHETT